MTDRSITLEDAKTITDIEITALENAVLEKGLFNPDIYINFKGTHRSSYVSVMATTKNELYSGDTVSDLFRFGQDKTVSEALKSAWNFIGDLKSAEEIERKAFIKSLGNLIDKGREIGIEDSFVNPLADMMKKLSENIIEDKRGVSYQTYNEDDAAS